MQSEIQVRLYEELNDYVQPGKRKRAFAQIVDEQSTVAQILEIIGVPSSQVDLVLVNGDSVSLSHRVSAHDRVSVYPVFESFDIKPVARVREKPLRWTRFIAGDDLRRLRTYLRTLRFDVLDADGWTVAALIEAAEREGRILLTRAPGLVNCGVSHFYLVKAGNPALQLIEVIRRLDLKRSLSAGWRFAFDDDDDIAEQ